MKSLVVAAAAALVISCGGREELTAPTNGGPMSDPPSKATCTPAAATTTTSWGTVGGIWVGTLSSNGTSVFAGGMPLTEPAIQMANGKIVHFSSPDRQKSVNVDGFLSGPIAVSGESIAYARADVATDVSPQGSYQTINYPQIVLQDIASGTTQRLENPRGQTAVTSPVMTDNGDLYWIATGATSSILRWDARTKSVAEIDVTGRYTDRLVAHGASVYWLVYGSSGGGSAGVPDRLLEVSSGETTERTVTTILSGCTTLLGATDTDVIATRCAEGTFDPIGSLELDRIPISGAAPTKIASGLQTIFKFAVNDTSVYWVDANAQDTVTAYPIAGGAPETVVTAGGGIIDAVTADDCSVFWSVYLATGEDEGVFSRGK